MRLLRALSAALILFILLGLVFAGPGPARAQDVDQAREDAATAGDRADRAASLLSETASRRAGIEEELAASLTRLARLSDELTRVSVRLDELRQSLAIADTNLSDVNQDLTLQAVDAYVRAVTISAASVVGAGTAESAIVAATSLESTIGSDQAAVASLTIKRRDLEGLRHQYAEDQEQVTAIRQEVDAETAHLEELLAEADRDLAHAAAQARIADAAHREALDAVDLARAQEEERQRQAERQAATTTTQPENATPEATTTTTSTVAPSPTTPPPAPVSGGDFPPAVERWRPLVSTYFPAALVDGALAVMKCESGGDPEAYNPYSGASGLFQFLPSTWATVSPGAGFGGMSVFDAEANIGTAAWLSDYYAGRGSSPWAPWTCRP
ncbi:MAG TPA: transglycosylase SLT domain-containing protein [Acidimicrobiia bacterium]|nr:transglycosylase SLT domain-containing protein [Acidimicrobiia bacterium]